MQCRITSEQEDDQVADVQGERAESDDGRAEAVEIGQVEAAAERDGPMAGTGQAPLARAVADRGHAAPISDAERPLGGWVQPGGSAVANLRRRARGGPGPAGWDKRPMWLTLLIFLVPLLLSNALQSLGQTGSSILVGRLLGVDALAAISAFFPAFFFLGSFVIGLASASSVLIGQAYGSGNEERMKAIAGTALTSVFLLGLIVATLGGIYTRELLGLIGTPASVMGMSIAYARVILYAAPFLFLTIIYTTLLRGTGDSQTPFYFLILSTALNLLLAAAFILGWLGLPKMGVTGAALAQGIASAVTLVAFAGYLIAARHPLGMGPESWRYLRVDLPIFGLLVRIGAPSGVQLVMVSLSEIAVISFVNRFGAHATAAYGAVNQIVSYVQFPAISLGIAASIFGAQAIGAGRSDRLRHVVRASVALNYVVGGVLIVLAYVFSRAILGLFITDADTLDVAHGLLMITLWSYLIFGNSAVLSGIMRASGTVFWPTAISLASIWLVEVPTAYVLSHRIGLTGVWIGYPVAFCVGLALQFGYYTFVWRTQPHERLIR